MKRITTSLAALALAATGVVVLGSPAQAAGCGGPQEREFDTSGYNTDVYIRMCITENSQGQVRASANGYWTDGGGLRKFDNFDIKVRLERVGGADIATARCDDTAEMNRAESGTIQCTTRYISGLNPARVTADATVYYNLDSDGEGGFVWGLRGSPAG
ncbi:MULTISPECIES: hypothetical protein [Streptomyces]|uniref:Secreted protein n=1 Tax=Streptomyces xanthii TaxID=2768069 RepID=A0A7H1BI41_9ACTN|nr:hypothetical protein [Streptomyces xanthii]QNS08396.1 hypothetical protein IAG42_35605 [Streptomyces xanthii]